MARLADDSIKFLAVGNGRWQGEDANIAVAIALAESGGRTDARGDVTLQDETWGPSIGLWQIRSLKRDWATGRTRDALANLNPTQNAIHAREIYDQQGWGAWSVYNNGRYRAFLPRARRAVPRLRAEDEDSFIEGFVEGAGDAVGDLVGGVTDPVSGALDAAQDAVGILNNISQLIGRAVRWIRDENSWFRVAQVMVGGALVIGGTVVMARPVIQPAAQAAGSAARLVATRGR